MSTSATTTTPTAQVKPRRWWLRALTLAALAIAASVAVLSYSLNSARVSLADAEAEADRSDPDWRLEDLEAKRRVVADADNSAFHTIAVLRKGMGVSVQGVPNYDVIFKKLRPNVELNQQQSELIRGQLSKIVKPLAEARKLKDMPYGRFKIAYSPDFLGTLIPNHHDSREVADWLMHDAFLLAQDENGDLALESCQAVFNAARTMGDDPLLISHLTRIANQSKGINALERVLAQTQAKDESLERLQLLLAKEIAESSWSHGVRGERAGTHLIITNIRAGKINMPLLRGWTGMKRPATLREWMYDIFPSTMLKYYPEHLQHLTEVVELSKRPLHEQRKRLTDLDSAAAGKSPENPITALFSAANLKVYEADCRSQAQLRATWVALACERYRLKHERWPESLDALVKANLIDAVPLDPYDGQPLRFRRIKEGVVVYAIGPDLADDQGLINRTQALTTGFDLGFQLWDRELRRQAPLPLVALPEGQ